MKILVYGAGVLGCNLARNLFRAGKNVTLLARGKWAEEIKKNGLRIKDKFSPRVSLSRIPVTTELKLEAPYDVIFVVMRYTQLDTIMDTLRASRAKNIIFVGNNVRAEATAAALPEKNVLFAFASSAGHRESDRVASVDLKKITIGQLSGAPSNEGLIGEIFSGTKYKVAYEPNMGDYLLCHAAFVLPAAFACYKTDGDLKKLKGNTAYLSRMIDATYARAGQRHPLAGHPFRLSAVPAGHGAALHRAAGLSPVLLSAGGGLCAHPQRQRLPWAAGAVRPSERGTL